MSENFPLYSQLPNACGLATFLMFVNPDKNIKLKDFLDYFYPKVKDFYAIDQEKKEFQWAYVLDYLLLKSIGNNKLSDYLSKKIPDMFVQRIDGFGFGPVDVMHGVNRSVKEKCNASGDYIHSICFSMHACLCD